MARISTPGLALLCAVLVMSPITVRSNSLKQIVLYATLISRGPQANAVVVAGPGPGPPTDGTKFGEITVFDTPLRESLNSNAPEVGSIQGFRAVSSKDGTQAYYSESIIIERGKYKVGTLQAQGILKVAGPTVNGEISVPSGTDAYRFVSGYMEVQTVQQFPAASTTIIEVKISYRKIDD